MARTRKRRRQQPLEKASAIAPASAGGGSDDSHDSFVNEFECGDAAHREPLPDPAGRIIGAYRLIRSLGSGGMGEVFLAERADEQFRQNVAIKLVRRGLLSNQVQGRLRQERQILASLDHPNIARLYDGGTTTDGTPYIVMEYIDGEPIDIHCDRRQLTIEQRLRLFITVCSAVHRAHQNLIVHRDLKPSNILVTADGVPKLLDFGIAKRLDDTDASYTMAVTQADVRVMTPDHASPEQVRGEIISTASDVYVLGVLLYELLCGYKPFALRGKNLGEFERAICEDMPAMPSEVIAAAERQADSGIVSVSAQRSATTAKLRRELSGDLDNIVAMAMRKEPERRYSSAAQLAGDVERYLSGLPVLARPDSWSYRAGKFLQRYALGVALSAALVATLIGFTVTVYMQSLRIEQERDLAQAQRSIADSQRERAEAVSAFLIDSFKVVDPFAKGGNLITARQILDNGATRIAHELNDQLAIKADVLDTIGSAYLGLGLPEQARPLIEQGLTVRRKLFGEDSAAVARSLYSLNQVYEKEGNLDAAEKLAWQSLEINQRQTGTASVTTATSLCRLGVIKKIRSELAAAEKLLQSCLDIRRARLGPYDVSVTIPLDNLAHIATQRNDNVVAKTYLTEALEIDRRARSEEHPQYIRHLLRLAAVTHDLGDTAEAEPLFRNAVALNQRVLGAEHPETIDTLSAFGTFLMETDRFAEARKVLTTVLEANRRARGPTHSYIGNDLENLGRLAYRQRDFTAAERYLEDALAIYRDTLPPTHGFIATALTTLGRTQLALNRLADAQTSLSEAVRVWQVEYGDNSTGYASANAALAWSKALQGHFAEAEPALLKAYPMLSRSTRKVDLEVAAELRQWIEKLYLEQGRPTAAREYFSRLQQN
ncbi:serine/threonine protein kinase [Steroidobacter sp. S1-65]|uniref:Serine/threonine protein kinase n=1 Tax=Steroidobacter gossypii TaxID=2805490 RepID=A0ABS1WRL0_9GAMM|nr:serine/threonine-protein kinase [Steroidobacter gossypii]MBM0103596.1 serine/threonine protein kinase [Steroidobacter gossypii]